jgi:sugar phosphate isomerase/epimerase
MRLGIHNRSLSRDNLQEAFRLAAQAGVEGVEVAYCTSQEARQLRRWENHAQAVSALAQAGNLAVPSLNLACLCGAPSLIGSPDVIESSLELITSAILAAKAVGAPVVLVPFFGKNTIEVEKELNKAADALTRLIEPAEEAGVILGVESTLNFDRQLFLLDHLGHTANVRVYFDTGDALAHKFDVATGIRDLGGQRIVQVHLKDVRIVEGAPPDFDVALGEGNVDFRAVAQALAAIRFDGWGILETPPGDDALSSAKANLKYAREILAAAK